MKVDELLELPPYEWPDDAYDTVLGTLRNGEAPLGDRLTAAELAADLGIMSDEVAGVLVKLFSDPSLSDELRSHAALALGGALEDASLSDDFEDAALSEKMVERVSQALRAVYEDESAPKDVRRRVLESAVRAPQDWHREAVLKSWAGDESWHLTAVFCMRFVPGFEREILESLSSEDSDVVYEAVAAAGEFEVQGAWRKVLALALSDDTNADVRLAAIDAVAMIKPTEAGAALAGLVDGGDEDVVNAAIEAIEMARAYAGIDLDDLDDLD